VRIPNLAGFAKDEVIIPSHSRNVYDAAIRAVGVKIIEVETPEARVGPCRQEARLTDQAPRTFGAVAREQLPWLYPLARRLVGEHAEDVVQECLIKAFRGFEQLRDQQAAPAWFRQILLNCVRDRHRREASLPRQDPVDDVDSYSLYRTIAQEDPWPYSDSVHLDFLATFDEDDVWRVLDRIDPRYRVPLVLVHMEGMPTAQVARMFGVARGTVLSWLHRGRKLFERELWRYAEETGQLTGAAGAGDQPSVEVP
jgi:RNA polymerase sigma-70 factor, ECF subfamily